MSFWQGSYKAAQLEGAAMGLKPSTGAGERPRELLQCLCQGFGCSCGSAPFPLLSEGICTAQSLHGFG